MNSTRFITLTIFASMLALSACNLPAGSSVTEGPGANLGPVNVTKTPGPTRTASFTPMPTATSTPIHPLISVSVNTNCRTGPGKVYDYLGSLMVGETAEVVAKDPTGQFWYIRNPDAEGYCWIWGQYATIVGDTSPLPVFTPIPTPTPALNFTFKYFTYGQCVNMFMLKFTVTNTGSVTWESYSLYTRNDTESISGTWSDNVFANPENCGVEPSAISANIPPGGSGTVGTIADFMHHAPTGDSIYAELKLCTQDNLAGQCVTHSISFTVP